MMQVAIDSNSEITSIGGATKIKKMFCQSKKTVKKNKNIICFTCYQ